MKIIDINGGERECESLSPDSQFPGFVKVTFVSKNRKGFVHDEWYPVKEFVVNNPRLKTIISPSQMKTEETLGAVSKSSETTLSDTKQDWKDDQFTEYPVWISRGKGEGQIRKITSNTHNTLTIDRPWTTPPDATSQYVVTYNIIEQNVAETRGNTFPSPV